MLQFSCMPIRIIALDLDGTLLNSHSEISPNNTNALVAACERGAQVVVTTGRRYYSALPYVKRLPCPVTMITSNGALISTPGSEVVYRNFLPREVARQALEAVRDYRPYSVAIFNVPGRGQVTMQENAHPEGPISWYLKTSAASLKLVPDLEGALETDPLQVMVGGPPAHIEPAEEILRLSTAGPHINLTWTKYLMRNVSILDVMNRGCSKGRALKYWAERCGIPPSEVMAIGDNFNDVEMLQFAGRPVLMGNRCEGLDGHGWHLTLSADEDGVAAAIRTYVLQ